MTDTNDFLSPDLKAFFFPLNSSGEGRDAIHSFFSHPVQPIFPHAISDVESAAIDLSRKQPSHDAESKLPIFMPFNIIKLPGL